MNLWREQGEPAPAMLKSKEILRQTDHKEKTSPCKLEKIIGLTSGGTVYG